MPAELATSRRISDVIREAIQQYCAAQQAGAASAGAAC